MVVIRWILGRIILLLDFIFTPRGVKRSAPQQAIADEQCLSLALYQFAACPFCVKVRRQMKRLSLNIELRDVKNNAQFNTELTEQGGRHKVPCLRITKANCSVQWLYESSDINAYLTQQFSTELVLCQD